MPLSQRGRVSEKTPQYVLQIGHRRLRCKIDNLSFVYLTEVK